jgi:hypothetical protein
MRRASSEPIIVTARIARERRDVKLIRVRSLTGPVLADIVDLLESTATSDKED